jgi:hypothetical protein
MLSKIINLPRILVAWMFNILAIAIILCGVALRVIAEWVYGVPATVEPESPQEGEMTAEALAQMIEDNYKDLGDGGASQEDFEAYLDAQEQKDRKVH